MSMTDNMNDFQHTELNAIKSRNQGGGGWSMSEFGHRMKGDVAIVRCVRFNSTSKMKQTIEYEIEPTGRSKVVLDNTGPVA